MAKKRNTDVLVWKAHGSEDGIRNWTDIGSFKTVAAAEQWINKEGEVDRTYRVVRAYAPVTVRVENVPKRTVEEG